MLVQVPARIVGILAGFGAGALIAANTTDLVVEARDALDQSEFALWMLVGAAVFLLSDSAVEKRFDQPQLPRSGLRLEHPAEHRAVGRPCGSRLGCAPNRNLWLWVVLACGGAAAVGYLLTDVSAEATGARMAAIAAGGLLAMLTNSLMPFVYERGRSLAGVATVVGFCLALVSSG